MGCGKDECKTRFWGTSSFPLRGSTGANILNGNSDKKAAVRSLQLRIAFSVAGLQILQQRETRGENGIGQVCIITVYFTAHSCLTFISESCMTSGKTSMQLEWAITVCMRLQFMMVVGMAFSLLPLISISSNSSSLAILLWEREFEICFCYYQCIFYLEAMVRAMVFTISEKQNCRLQPSTAVPVTSPPIRF